VEHLPELQAVKVTRTVITNPQTNKAIIDRRLRPPVLPPVELLCTSISCRYMRTDIMCKHDVMNIQHAHCGQSPFARNWYTYVLFSQVLGCMWAQCFHQLGGHVELPSLRCNCANMTRSSQYSALLSVSEEKTSRRASRCVYRAAIAMRCG